MQNQVQSLVEIATHSKLSGSKIQVPVSYRQGVGANLLDGQAGLDTAVLTGARVAYAINIAGAQIGVVNSDGTVQNTLQNIEGLKFSDGTLVLETSGNAGEAYRLYEAAFDRTPDKDGLSYWVKKMDSGTSLKDVSNFFASSKEFNSLCGANSTKDIFVETLYHNVLGRNGKPGGVAYLESQLGGVMTRADVLSDFSKSAEKIAGVAPAIGGGIWLS